MDILNYAPEPTGIGKYTGEMAEWLVAQGHAVEVIYGLPYYLQWQVVEGDIRGSASVAR